MRVLCGAFIMLLLTSCASPRFEIGTASLTWQGSAFDRAYSGSCVEYIRDQGYGFTVPGAYVTPDKIYIEDYVCEDSTDDWHGLRVILAHEVAHLVVCDLDEECATRTQEEWVAAGITLSDLGWPAP